MEHELQKNENGNVILKPLTGFAIKPMAGVAVLLQLQYVDSPLDIETENKWHQVQIALMPQQALSLAEGLQRAGNKLLEGNSAPEKPLN